MIDHAANERAEIETERALHRAEELLEDGNSVKDTMDILDDEFPRRRDLAERLRLHLERGRAHGAASERPMSLPSHPDLPFPHWTYDPKAGRFVPNPEKHPAVQTAQPYEARRCPECHLWIYTAAGPFAEGDPTKAEADWLHWEAEHLAEAPPSASAFGFPFFTYNEEPVEAVTTHSDPSARIAALAQQVAEAANELLHLIGTKLTSTEAASFGRVLGVAVRFGASEQEIL